MTGFNLNEGVGGGWTASEVQSTFKPTGHTFPTLPTIVLVTLSNKSEEKLVRLDLGKGMFLDAIPESVSPGAGPKLARSVVAHWPR
jgi:hypothetical protein